MKTATRKLRDSGPGDPARSRRALTSARLRAALAALTAGLAACSSEPRAVPIDVMTGQESDTFSVDPKVTRVDVVLTTLEGTTVKASAEPGGTFDLGELPEDQQITIEVTGVDVGGATVARGRTLSGILLASVEGAIPVFVQRVNQWARPPNGLVHAHVGAPAGVLSEQLLLLTGGASAAGKDGPVEPDKSDFYDLFGYGGSLASTFPRVPSTIVSLGSVFLLIDAAGATWINYAEGSTPEATAPDGLDSFGLVAGGSAIRASEGRTFVVGATRSGEPTDAVLEVNDDGTLTAHKLAQPRRGAAAVWVEGVGLVVAGGSASGAGVELLSEGGTAFVPRDAFPADPTEGAGAVIDPPGGVALIGGAAGGVAAATRRLDPTCVGECAVTVVEGATIPVAIGGVSAYALDGARAIVLGSEIGGEGLTRTFLVEIGGSVTELPLREPRRGATPIPAPNGTLVLLGGEHPDGTPALSVESFFPN